MNQTSCKLEVAPVMVGPLEVYESIGHWNTAVLVILSLHLLPVWAVATTLLCRSYLPFKLKFLETQNPKIFEFLEFSIHFLTSSLLFTSTRPEH